MQIVCTQDHELRGLGLGDSIAGNRDAFDRNGFIPSQDGKPKGCEVFGRTRDKGWALTDFWATQQI